MCMCALSSLDIFSSCRPEALKVFFSFSSWFLVIHLASSFHPKNYSHLDTPHDNAETLLVRPNLVMRAAVAKIKVWAFIIFKG